MRIALSGVLVCWVLVLSGQGFNRRYDAFGQGNEQTSFGLERAQNGYMVFSGSYEPDTIAPDSIVGTYSLILQSVLSGESH